MNCYDLRRFHCALRLNQAYRRAMISKKEKATERGFTIQTLGAKNDMCLTDLIAWVKRNPKVAAEGHCNYHRFLE